jgi:hypothetical protein
LANWLSRTGYYLLTIFFGKATKAFTQNQPRRPQFYNCIPFSPSNLTAIIIITMPRLLYNALVDGYKRNCEVTKDKFQLFLRATVRDDMPASTLRGQEGVLKEIYSFLIPLGGEHPFHPSMAIYRMHIEFCRIREFNFPVCALENCGGWDREFNKPVVVVGTNRKFWSGCLNVFSGCSEVLLRYIMHHSSLPWRQNRDGSYWDEMQLRKYFRQFAKDFCSEPDSCRGKCAVLPGDTVIWEFKEDGQREMKRFRPASKAELEDRGFIRPHEDCDSEQQQCGCNCNWSLLMEQMAAEAREVREASPDDSNAIHEDFEWEDEDFEADSEEDEGL